MFALPKSIKTHGPDVSPAREIIHIDVNCD